MNTRLQDWVIEHYGMENFHPGLGRMREALLPILDQLQKKRICTIAGTNGKGETSLWLSKFLGPKSHCVWISPHISRITERFRSEEGEIGEAELDILIRDCHLDVQRRQLKLSYYEFLFLVFCTWASQRSPDFLLLEVGLGGRLDAVNVLDAELVLLPSISRDHQEILGHRYDQILKEKLGLLRKNSLLVDFLDLRYLRERADFIAQTMGAKVIHLQESSDLKPSDFSRRNQRLAGAACEILLGERPQIDLNQGALENRGEHLVSNHDWHLFGSHNVDGLRKLIQFLHSGNYTFARPPFDAVIVTFSQRNLADLRVLFKMLKTSDLGPILVTSFAHPKAAPREILQKLAQEEGLEFVEDWFERFQHSSNRRVLVAGSYYFLGHLKDRLRGV
jgi:dihydrofolate synthase/folylpolyglutamate synthase